ncbi:membrane-bound lytic murein transglycosylase D [Flavobacteriaceae bacterium UJ101]|nr:membrane-bound lytic murein transglycosylase D [Flavobacteriaceae bacterium UJ101]
MLCHSIVLPYMRNTILYLCIVYSAIAIAQVPSASTGENRITPLSVEKKEANRIYLSNADRQYLEGVNSQWSERLNQTLLYNDYASNNADVIKTIDPVLLKNRLEKLNNETPLDIEYNEVVQAYVQKYLKMGPWMGKVMGLAEYYFPLFEDKLAKYNIPLEIKYLAIVESTLNPRAGSHKGAIGLWQFIHSTGKMYDLEINSYVDERMDPLKSTEAACQYLERHYKIYGDWDLVLAAYNSGAGNVNKAIKRSGGYKNYWNIRRYLPRETQGYIPSFIAMTYLFEYAKEHNLKPSRLDVSFYETDTVLVKNKLSFSNVSKFTGVPYEKIEFLNPQYKNDYIPRKSGKQYALRLPQSDISKFVGQENYIYSMTAQAERAKEQPIEKSSPKKEEAGTFTLVEVERTHQVKENETMAMIANQYGVGISDIIAWNDLSGATVSPGQELTLRTKIKKYKETPKVVENSTSSKATTPTVKKKATSTKPKGKKQYYTVKKGDILAKIATKYGVSQSNIKSWNKLKSSNLYAGQKLTIYSNKVVKDKITHKVRKGESLGLLASKYNVNVSDIKNWNKLKSSTLKIGQALVIYPGKKGKSKSTTSSKGKKTTHTVKKGEVLGTIANRYKVSVSDLKKWNNLRSNNLKVGQKLIVYGGKSSSTSSKKSSSKNKKGPIYHTVKSGESLYTIAKKFPGISADNIKALNGLKSTNLKVGQKLLIKK